MLSGVPRPPPGAPHERTHRGSTTSSTGAQSVAQRKESFDKTEKKKVDDARKRAVEWLKKHASSARAALDSARGCAASTPTDTDNPDAKLEKVARQLDTLSVRFTALEKAIRDCTDTVFAKKAVGGAMSPAQGFAPPTTSNAAVTSPISPGMTVTAPGSAGRTKDDNPQGKLLASVYFFLESLTHNTRAEKGVVMLYNGRANDELQSIAVVGQKVAANSGPATVRLPASTGIAGSVLTSCIAVNQTVASDKRRDVESKQGSSSGKLTAPPVSRRRDGMLCFPIVNGTSDPVGIIQLTNKNHGADSFGNDDEHLCYATSQLLAYLLRRYPVDWLSMPYNPAPLHHALPAESPLSSLLTRSLPQQIVKHENRRLIYRTNQSGQHVRQKLLAPERDVSSIPQLSTCASLVEVDEYIVNLEECWRRSVGLNIDYEGEYEGKSHQLRLMREEAKKDKRLICNLQDSLSMRNAEFDGYRSQYEGVKEDLRLLMDVKSGKLPLDQLLA